MKQTTAKRESRLLPILCFEERDFLVDIERRQFRDIGNAAYVVSMHSEKGRRMIAECAGQEWEDTFYAAESLNMLGASLNPEKSHLCRTWCRDIVFEKGIKENRPDVIYYCFGVLTALGAVDEDISQLVSGWFSSATEELLLTNISLNYENVHFSIMLYHLLNTAGKTPSAQLNLLTERINIALASELANIRA